MDVHLSYCLCPACLGPGLTLGLQLISYVTLLAYVRPLPSRLVELSTWLGQ